MTPRGKYILKLGVNSKITVTIHVDHTGIDKGGLFGTHGIVYIDPNSHPQISTTLGVEDATTIRILAHELGHALTGTLDVGPGDMNNVRENENPIVTHLNPPEPARTAYYAPNSDGG